MYLAIPGRILAIRDEEPFPVASVDYGGVRKQASLAFVPDATVGEYVLVHVGFAIAKVDELEVLKTLEILRAMDDSVEREIGEPLR
jgi:hydrogenase expression/formation protein HypC